jgi:hypothetical protein
MQNNKPPLNKKDWIAGLEKGLQIIEAFNDTHPRLTCVRSNISATSKAMATCSG